MIVHSLVRIYYKLFSFKYSHLPVICMFLGSIIDNMFSFLADFLRKTVEIYCPTSIIFVYFCYHFESVKV